MDQSQEILLGHSVFASRKYGYHGYRHIARTISNKLTEWSAKSHAMRHSVKILWNYHHEFSSCILLEHSI